jgi:uncharacterized cupredoxin-like copper-binding protein
MTRLLLVTAAVVGMAACGRADAQAPAVRTVVLTAHYSRWSTSHLEIGAGTTVRFVVYNQDPIDHELIVGDAGVQDRHERGTEAKHGLRPGEITIPAGTTVATAVSFDRPGPLLFGCHVPGHWAFGMHGTLQVLGTGAGV